jgi:WD40 repeat protein
MFRAHAFVGLGFLAAAVAGGYLIGGRAGGTAPALARFEPGQEVRVLGPERASALEATTSVAWEPGGCRLATGRRDGAVCLWESDGTPADRWAAHEVPVNAVCFVGDHSALLSAGSDGGARLWALSGTGPTIRAEVRTPGKVLSAASSPDGKTLAVGHVGAISLWRVDPGRLTPAGRLDTPPHPTCALAFAPDGGTLAAGNCADGLVRLWRLGDSSMPERLDGSDDYQARALAFSADGRALFVLDTDGNVVCLDLADRRRTVARLGMTPVRGGAFGPDGRQVLAANFDGLARLAGVRGPLPPFRGTTGTRE